MRSISILKTYPTLCRAKASIVCIGLALALSAIASALDSPPVSPPSEPVPATVEPTVPAAEPPPTEAQVTEELPKAKSIVDSAAQYIGSADAIAAITSYSLNATMSGAMGELVFEVKSLRTGAFMLKQSRSGMPAGTVMFDGTEGWVAQPDGLYDLVKSSQLMQAQQQFEMMFPVWLVLALQEHTTSVETVGQGEFAGQDCFKVRFGTNHDSGITRFFQYETKGNTMLGMSMVIDGPMAQPVEFIYSDWKPIADLNLFHAIAINQFGHTMNLTYTDVAFNAVDPIVFDRPDAVKELLMKRDAAPSAQAPEPTAPPAEEPASLLPGNDDRSR